MADKNTFGRSEVANEYQYVFRYPKESIQKLAGWLLDNVRASHDDNNTINILDVGIGDGAFTIPLLEALYEELNRRNSSIKIKLFAYDKSKPMLDKFQEALSSSAIKGQITNPMEFDAEKNNGIPKEWENVKFDVAIITLVLHYLRFKARKMEEIT